MLTGNGNEIGKKINTSNWSKKPTLHDCAAHFLVHSFDVVLHGYIVKLHSYTSYVENVVYMCSPKVLLLVFLFAFCLLLLIFTLLAASLICFLI